MSNTPEMEDAISNLNRHVADDLEIGADAGITAPFVIDALSEVGKRAWASHTGDDKKPAATTSTATPPTPPKSEEPSFLTKMAGPLPVYGWGLVGVGALGVGYGLLKLLRKR